MVPVTAKMVRSGGIKIKQQYSHRSISFTSIISRSSLQLLQLLASN
ncbi:hypothetical protein [Paenibacillus sp. NRS-1760]